MEYITQKQITELTNRISECRYQYIISLSNIKDKAKTKAYKKQIWTAKKILKKMSAVKCQISIYVYNAVLLHLNESKFKKDDNGIWLCGSDTISIIKKIMSA